MYCSAFLNWDAGEVYVFVVAKQRNIAVDETTSINGRRADRLTENGQGKDLL